MLYIFYLKLLHKLGENDILVGKGVHKYILHDMLPIFKQRI